MDGIGYFIGVVIWAIIWGVAASAIAKNKGYENEASKWFWLGFFFSFIAVIIIATKPDNNTRNRSDSISDNSSYGTASYGGWKCKNCGREHQGYETTCICGAKKDGTFIYKGKTETTSKGKENNSHIVSAISETERLKLIKDYKALFDTGIITQEEFEKKKSQLLWGKTTPLSDKQSDSDEYDTSEEAEENNANLNNQNPVRLLSTDNELFGICPECGARQRKSRTTCYKCGVPLIIENS